MSILNQTKAWLDGMTNRERQILGAGLIFVTIIFLWLGVYEPIVNSREHLKKKIAQNRIELIEVKALSERVVLLRERFDRFNQKLASRRGQFSPLSEVESLANAAGVREAVTSMAPSGKVELDDYTEQLVDLKLKEVTLGRLIAFIKELRNSENALRVKRLNVKPVYEDPSLLNVSLSIAIYEPAA